MKVRITLLTFLALAIASLNFACGGMSSEQKNIPHSVSFKAALIPTGGRVLPVARGQFYLLRKDLAEILREKKSTATEFVRIPDDRAFELRVGMPPEKVKPIGMDEDIIKEHIAATAKTDFDGNGKFENVPKGTYYLVGVAFAPENYVHL